MAIPDKKKKKIETTKTLKFQAGHGKHRHCLINPICVVFPSQYIS